MAEPQAFGWERMADRWLSLGNPQAMATHMRVERWTHDEFPLPGSLFEEILEFLYREDRFRRGTLMVGDRRVGIDALTTPVMAVTNPLGGVVPPQSILAALAAAPAPATVLEYEGDRGPMLQHVGPLVTRAAHERLWPKILDWMVEQWDKPER
jgi:polyhydroxyalkanoate synthase